jgi:hypothetical protein
MFLLSNNLQMLVVPNLFAFFWQVFHLKFVTRKKADGLGGCEPRSSIAALPAAVLAGIALHDPVTMDSKRPQMAETLTRLTTA